MERALNLDLLTAALGTHERLPSPVDLQQILSDVEVGLFTGTAAFDPPLLDAAWYLQSVAVARGDLGVYEPTRQRQAHQVSGHIFDLALQSGDISTLERLRYTFAAQIAYLGGDLTPNASALARRIDIDPEPETLAPPSVVSLEAGILLLALDRPRLYPLLGVRSAQIGATGDAVEDSSYAVADAVVRGARALLNFLTNGAPGALESAQTIFRSALVLNAAEDDVDSRWVAAHLLRTSDGLGRGAVWTALPPALRGAARAMTHGDPPVLQLWPPQLAFLAGNENEPSPLDPTAQRLILSFPTSAGKSLLAQILVTVHLTNGAGDVCVVAPTHSLCRELGYALQRRLRTLGMELHDDSIVGLDIPRPATARVVVMTPEKLAARLRSNPGTLLAEFGMFVIDEAHLVADAERGWRLEEALSLLHSLTRETPHRMVILSAALGNQAHVLSWLDSGNGVLEHHEDWRGPRRLGAVFTTIPRWIDRVDEPASGRRLARQRYPLDGIVHLRTGLGGRYVRGRFSNPVGTFVRRQQQNGGWTTDGAATTTQRARLLPLIEHVATAGPTLIVEATKTEAQRLAEALAAPRDDDPAVFALADLIRARLGAEHPLTRVVRKGVAFHHAALPVDIQSEIEDAVRSGRIRTLVSTSTLVEGVNLPFKTVIIARRGYHDGEGVVEVIDDARLLNAIGRAGRAGRETEGWLILVEQETFTAAMFDPLDRTGAELDMRSTMATELALERLALLEAALREHEDALFLSSNAPEADAFVSFIWFIAQALEELRGGATAAATLDVVESTLAWQQLDPDSRARMRAVASTAFEAFTTTAEPQRRRWAQSGLALPSAASLDDLTVQILADLPDDIEALTFPTLTELLLGAGRLSTLLSLAESRRSGFKPRRNAPRGELIPVDLLALVIDWVSGAELQDLGERHLNAVTSEDYRYEQLAEFIANAFEHFIPWTLGVVVSWVNEALEREGRPQRIPDDLPAAIHFGVGTRDALALMLGGVRSRRLANRVGQVRQAAGDDGSIREWLSTQEPSIWRAELDASPTEIADLLAFARDPNVQLVDHVLNGDEYVLPYIPRIPVLFESSAQLRPAENEPAPAPFAISVGDDIVGRISVEHDDDIRLLTGIGIPLDISIRPGDPPVLVVRIAPDVVAQ